MMSQLGVVGDIRNASRRSHWHLVGPGGACGSQAMQLGEGSLDFTPRVCGLISLRRPGMGVQPQGPPQDGVPGQG